MRHHFQAVAIWQPSFFFLFRTLPIVEYENCNYLDNKAQHNQCYSTTPTTESAKIQVNDYPSLPCGIEVKGCELGVPESYGTNGRLVGAAPEKLPDDAGLDETYSGMGNEKEKMVFEININDGAETGNKDTGSVAKQQLSGNVDNIGSVAKQPLSGDEDNTSDSLLAVHNNGDKDEFSNIPFLDDSEHETFVSEHNIGVSNKLEWSTGFDDDNGSERKNSSLAGMADHTQAVGKYSEFIGIGAAVTDNHLLQTSLA